MLNFVNHLFCISFLPIFVYHLKTKDMETKKFEVNCVINGESFNTVVTAKNKAEAFCIARNKAEAYYHKNGVHLTSSEPINHPNCYVKEYVQKQIDWNDPIFDIN